MSKLEKFIQKNRQEFDAWEPSDQLWGKLAKGLDDSPGTGLPVKTVRMVPIARVWQIAAGFVLILVAALTIQYYLSQNDQQSAVAARQSLEQIAPELAEVEQFYTQQVKLKRQELQQSGAHKLGMDKDVDRELSSLDSAYSDLKLELYKTGSQEVIDVMIQNLLFRVDILNKQMDALQNVKKLNNQTHEKQI